MTGRSGSCWSRVFLAFFLLSVCCHLSMALAPLEPRSGAWFGVNSDNDEPQAEYAARVGLNPVTFGTFVQFPLRPDDVKNLNSFLEQVARRGGIALVTLEPMQGLAAITEAVVAELAVILQAWERAGTSFMVRFAHEMNGSWYPWSQQPTLYIEKFRMVAAILHGAVRKLAMLWAPNNGSGYPFAGGKYLCKPGDSDFTLLDTNHDGKLDMYDDMYTPFYPGDEAVDWVGMTLYWWGNSYPYGRNDQADPWSFYNRLRGLYRGPRGDETMIPDFYGLFCGEEGGHNKPLAIAETAALFNVEAGCCSDELSIKASWWNQVLNVGGETPLGCDVSQRLPRIKMVNWFDWRKPEAELQYKTVDWSFSTNATVREAFKQRLMAPALTNGRRYWKLLEDWRAEQTVGTQSTSAGAEFS